MDAPVTIGGIAITALVIVGLMGACGGLIFILDLLNPFRSGH